MTLWIGILFVVFLAALSAFYLLLRSRNMQMWFPSYVRRQRRQPIQGPTHVLFCFVDHFEPMWARPDYETECRRVKRWVDEYGAMANRHRDADGLPPGHCFFYPEEEYRKEHLDGVVEICRQGFGEIDVHLHHDNDTAEGLTEKLQRFRKILHETHNALPVNDKGEPVYGFIHGNWCLDNARPDGRYCGVNNELQVLAECGCYVDYTFPAAPDPSQTPTINQIYYATDDPQKPRSHDHGVRVKAGGSASGDLMLIQGPLMLNWRDRKLGLIPRIENGDIRAGQEPSPQRTDLWVEANVHIQGRPEWVFIKVHTHGTQEASTDVLLGDPVDAMYSDLESRYNDGENYVLHYVSSREMYNIAKAAEAGLDGDPNQYRDYVYKKPEFSPPG
ncbi:MAG: hypothetical protein AB8B96_08530 [Lysobacterales bacterium]